MQLKGIKVELATNVADVAQEGINKAKIKASEGFSGVELAKVKFNVALRDSDAIVSYLQKFIEQSKEMGFTEVVQKLEKLQNDAKQLSKEINAPLSKLKSL